MMFNPNFVLGFHNTTEDMIFESIIKSKTSPLKGTSIEFHKFSEKNDLNNLIVFFTAYFRPFEITIISWEKN